MQINPLGNFPIDKFLSEYWQKKPLLLRNALPEVTSPVSAELLAGLACEEEVESRIIIQHQSSNKWDLLHGPFSDEAFTELPTSHWTLLVQAVDHWIPEAAKFLNQFNFIPRWRIDDLMMSYANDGGGVGPHFDNYDVFLVQTDGKRKWEIGNHCDKNTELIEDLPLSILRNFSAQESWILEPGDILYVPPGFSHNGTAQGDHCITCSVGFRAPSHSDILREYTDYVSDHLDDAIRYKDPEAIRQNSPGEITNETIEELQNILRKYIEDKDLVSDWFGRYSTTQKYASDASNLEIESSAESFNEEQVKKYLSSGKIIFRNESSRFTYQYRNEKTYLYVDGQCIDNIPDSDKDKNHCIKAFCEKSNFQMLVFH